MRDHADNVVVICSIENFDPMGVHTGDSITVAPAQTLTDVEYQRMRDAAFACIRRIGVETGGSNVQFAVEPEQRRHGRHRDEPARVAQSSALASKATGFPIAKIAAKLAVGYRLDEVTNDITGETPASFEPTIDYVVTKVPRWAFEKLPGRVAGARHADAVGRRGDGDRPHVPRVAAEGAALARDRAARASTATRPSASYDALRRRRARAHGRGAHARAALPGRGRAAPRRVGRAAARGHRHRPVVPRPDPRRSSRSATGSPASAPTTHDARATGGGPSGSASPTRSSRTSGASTEDDVRAARLAAGVRGHLQDRRHVRGRVRGAARRTTTAPTRTRTRSRRSTRPAVVILGSGPNRIGQGVEFDYCCVHAAFALSDAGFETVMVNCNPETVSTDYDTSDRLFFEPLTVEDVLNVCDALQARATGGALDGRDRGARRPDAAEARAARSSRPGIPVLGTSPDVDRPGRGPRAVQRAVRPARHPAARGRHRDDRRGGAGDRRTASATRCWCARRTCSAAARCRSSTTTTTSTPRWPSSRPTGSLGREGGLSAERPALDRPLPRGRDRGRRRRAARRAPARSSSAA